MVVLLVLGGFLLVANLKSKPLPALTPQSNGVREVIGQSVEGRDIESYKFGHGPQNILLVGGIHGGYEWNSVALAYQAIDYLDVNPSLVPENLSVTIIPSLNPDGVFQVTGKEGRFSMKDVSASTTVLASGRFNKNGVDLNRNFDCKWKASGTWQGKKVSAGTKAFSEPEALALKNYVEENRPIAVVFWHSQANAVYASECESGILPVTLDVMDAYAKAGGYPAVKSFTAYEVTGDAEGWLASVGIPAITVELKTHESIEWDKNLAGIKSLFNYFK